jgi:hypothetical protein
MKFSSVVGFKFRQVTHQEKVMLRKSIFMFGLAVAASGVQAGTWSQSTTILQTGAWGPWFGVVVTDRGSAVGCDGTGTKVIDIATSTPTNRVQVALLLTAHATGKPVKLYYDQCVNANTIITNVQMVE